MKIIAAHLKNSMDIADAEKKKKRKMQEWEYTRNTPCACMYE